MFRKFATFFTRLIPKTAPKPGSHLVVLAPKESSVLDPQAGLRPRSSDTPAPPAPRSPHETHTGIQFEEGDFRKNRFETSGGIHEHNKHFALDLIAEEPPIGCKGAVTWCDGGGGPTGHPRVFINLNKPGTQSCGYCGLRYFRE